MIPEKVSPFSGQTWESFVNQFLGIIKITRVDEQYIEILDSKTNKTLLRAYKWRGEEVRFRWKTYTVGLPKQWFIDRVIKPEQNKELLPLPEPQQAGHQVELDFRSRLEKQADSNNTNLIKQSETPCTAPAAASHKQTPVIMQCVKNDIPVYLVGEAGTGKNFTLQAIAKELGLDFYFTNSVQQEYKITGFIDAGGKYHETEFYKAFTNGGLFFLDEIDASIPEVLVLLNAAIANKYFEFPNGKVNAHSQFRVVAAGNTCGNGASELYTGRLTLDSATLDRFVVIEFDYDEAIELFLAEGNDKLVNFVRGLRDFAKNNGLHMTFSYRCIINIVKLEKTGLELSAILQIAVFKGCDKDTIKMFKINQPGSGEFKSAGRYYYAMEVLQKAA